MEAESILNTPMQVLTIRKGKKLSKWNQERREVAVWSDGMLDFQVSLLYYHEGNHNFWGFCLAVVFLLLLFCHLPAHSDPSPCTCSNSSDNEGTTDKLQLVLEIVQEALQVREVEEWRGDLDHHAVSTSFCLECWGFYFLVSLLDFLSDPFVFHQ